MNSKRPNTAMKNGIPETLACLYVHARCILKCKVGDFFNCYGCYR
jgi:hypothetical protein